MPSFVAIELIALEVEAGKVKKKIQFQASHSKTIRPISMQVGLHIHRININHPTGARVAFPFVVGMKAKSLPGHSLTFTRT